MKVLQVIIVAGLALIVSSPATKAMGHSQATDAVFAQAVEAVRAKEYGSAVDIFSDLSEQGEADAQFNLALLLKAGLGRPKNYEDAYFWFVLSLLGNEQRAEPMVDELSDLLPPPVQTEIYERISERLDQQLAVGNKRAIMKYAGLHANFLIEPDIETAYVWYSIGQALGLRGANDGTAAMSALLEPEALIAAQRRALDDFESSEFAAQPSQDTIE